VSHHILAALELLVGWMLWAARNPQDAGVALAAAEGASSAYLFQENHLVLGAVTAAGAVEQLSASTNDSDRAAAHRAAERDGEHPLEPTDVVEELERLVQLRRQGDLSDTEFVQAKQRRLGVSQSPESPKASATVTGSPAVVS